MSTNQHLSRDGRQKPNIEELAEHISAAMSEDGKRELQPGLFFYRASEAIKAVHAVADPSFCVIAQGSKEVQLAGERFRYDPAHYLLCTMQLPLVGSIEHATRDEPYLSLRVVLDPSVVTSVMVEAGFFPPQSEGGVRAIDVSPLSADLLDATLRLARLAGNSRDYAVLAPLVHREIAYRLLSGEQGERMRHLTKLAGRTHRIAQAIDTIRSNFDKPLQIGMLARELNMSVSGFHAHFKSATAMTPLQFQKQLRLQEARRLLMTEDCDAAQAGFRVGYDDASHFSRDYKRHFGKPPKRDVEGLRDLPKAESSR